MNPEHPVYVISKGRWKSRLTAIYLDRIGVPFHIVVEPQEHDDYARVIGEEKVLTLPFSNLGQGSIPARNWVWEHSIERGAKWHWILDDNIRGFYRYNRNLKTPVSDGTIFRVAELFTERYENVAQSGFNYFMFVVAKIPPPPYYLNTRVYSCMLLRNDLDYRWRGRYNEDTDLSLRMLKDGWCTVLFNAFLADKMNTLSMKGGNTDELYAADDGRLKMAESLVEQHPDVARVSWKFGRWQHHVDYSPFRHNKLIRKDGLVVPEGVNDYGMKLQQIDGDVWRDRPDLYPRGGAPTAVEYLDLNLKSPTVEAFYPDPEPEQIIEVEPAAPATVEPEPESLLDLMGWTG